MMPAQFHIDVLSELERVLPSYNLIVPSPVVRELTYIKNRGRGKNKIAASVALKIANSPPMKVVKFQELKGELVDDTLLRIAKEKGVLCTNDRELRERARKKGINVVYLRQRSYLSVDGYL
jgi:hypothetical protein